MNEELAPLDESVANLLQIKPEAARLFRDLKTACATCLLARFCTLRDVMDIYHLDRENFLKGLAKFSV